jgi:EAL domain-containing protein (putative c-di-GMP-specific phosphodiesterase class I)
MKAPPHHGHVLVVDDDPAVLKMCRIVLEREGWHVTVADNGRLGLAAVHAAAGNLDCVVSDVNMPELDGHGFLREVGVFEEDLPVLLMTADPHLDGAVRAMEAGAITYLSKPFLPEQLASNVARAARRHGVARMRRRAAVFAEASEGRADIDELRARFERALSCCWMAYQPVIDARSGAVRAYEALLRTEEVSMQRPDVFIGVAERFDRVIDLGRVVRRTIAADLAVAPPGVRMFVNLHPHELLDEQLFTDANPLRASASRVVIELTERVALDSMVDATRRVGMLRQAGFAIAIDDLGAGYASIGSLAAVEPEVVKLDMGLVRGIDSQPRRRRIVTATATLCRELGSEVVAEGIETEGERDALREHVDLMPGYLYGRPARGFS